jgi:hypothetical protein
MDEYRSTDGRMGIQRMPQGGVRIYTLITELSVSDVVDLIAGLVHANPTEEHREAVLKVLTPE